MTAREKGLLMALRQALLVAVKDIEVYLGMSRTPDGRRVP